jgi:Putative transposase
VGKTRHKTMTLTTDEFIRRFLLHVLPSGFHRTRHYGLLANTGRRDNLARVRELLQVAPVNAEPMSADASDKAVQPTFVCPDCGAAMIIVEILARKQLIRAPPRQRGAP